MQLVRGLPSGGVAVRLRIIQAGEKARRRKKEKEVAV